MQDNENKRINAGYEIIACLPIGNVEFVVGQNIHNPNMFVTWEYKKEGTCILGWFNDSEIRDICNINGAVRLVITLGYAGDGYELREKKRKSMKELVKNVDG